MSHDLKYFHLNITEKTKSPQTDISNNFMNISNIFMNFITIIYFRFVNLYIKGDFFIIL
jgi:hypothetical protein